MAPRTGFGDHLDHNPLPQDFLTYDPYKGYPHLDTPIAIVEDAPDLLLHLTQHRKHLTHSEVSHPNSLGGSHNNIHLPFLPKDRNPANFHFRSPKGKPIFLPPHPVRRPKVPVDVHALAHDVHALPPVMQAFDLVFHTSAPVKHSSAPVKHVSAPVVHSSAPVKHVSAPVVHSSAPVKHVSAPVVHSSAPAVHVSGFHDVILDYDPYLHPSDGIESGTFLVGPPGYDLDPYFKDFPVFGYFGYTPKYEHHLGRRRRRRGTGEPRRHRGTQESSGAVGPSGGYISSSDQTGLRRKSISKRHFLGKSSSYALLAREEVARGEVRVFSTNDH
ncbi:uncharacterized protein [Palaemon carinicauda]|uniref:uncharacterized protein isoform X2 n=1 Tax=Palaemon carinicauda TaxID=392227 RepID=UPI0035B695E3